MKQRFNVYHCTIVKKRKYGFQQGGSGLGGFWAGFREKDTYMCYFLEPIALLERVSPGPWTPIMSAPDKAYLNEPVFNKNGFSMFLQDSNVKSGCAALQSFIKCKLSAAKYEKLQKYKKYNLFLPPPPLKKCNFFCLFL